MFNPSRSPTPVLVLSLAALTLSSSALAGDRRFTYSYDTTTLKAGEVEFEQWVTWKTDKASNSSFNRFDFREEL